MTRSILPLALGALIAVSQLAPAQTAGQHNRPDDRNRNPGTRNDRRTADQPNRPVVSDGNNADNGRWDSVSGRWNRTSDLIGMRVHGSDNADLGKIEDVQIDPQSGRVLYGVVMTGDNRYVAVPWSSFDLRKGQHVATLNMNRQKFSEARTFDGRTWPNMADSTWATETNRYFDQPPYWEDGQHQQVLPDQRAAYDRWFSRSQSFQRSSDIIGRNVRSNGNADLGKVSNVVIDPQTGRVLYGVVQTDNEYVAVPWSAFQTTPDNSQFTINTTPQAWRSARRFSGDRWPNIGERTWMNESWRTFNQQPFWENSPLQTDETKRPGQGTGNARTGNQPQPGNPPGERRSNPPPHRPNTP